MGQVTQPTTPQVASTQSFSMVFPSIFTRLPGVLRFLRRTSLSSLALDTIGFRLRRPFTARLRLRFSRLSFAEAQTITRLSFEARLAAERSTGVGFRRALEARDIPIIPSVTDDPVFGDRYQTRLSYQWFDATTGQSAWVNVNIGTNQVPSLEVLQAAIKRQIAKGTASFIYQGRFETFSEITFKIGVIVSIHGGF